MGVTAGCLDTGASGLQSALEIVVLLSDLGESHTQMPAPPYDTEFYKFCFYKLSVSQSQAHF